MKLQLLIAICATLTVSGVAQSGAVNIDQTFSGVGHASHVDTNGDGSYATPFSFETRGSPGRSTILSMGEFTPFVPGDCPGGGLTSHVVQQSFAQTFSDLSMLYYVTTAARTCVDPASSEITCELEGIITGGSGRFEGATGTWNVACEIFLVGQTVRATTGTLKGTVNVPPGGRD